LPSIRQKIVFACLPLHKEDGASILEEKKKHVKRRRRSDAEEEEEDRFGTTLAPVLLVGGFRRFRLRPRHNEGDGGDTASS